MSADTVVSATCQLMAEDEDVVDALNLEVLPSVADMIEL